MSYISVMAPGHGVVAMAGYLQTPWKIGDLSRVLAELRVSGSIHFHKTLARSQNRKFGQCEQLALPSWFIEEYADKIEEWTILRTFSSSKPWRVRLSVSRKPSGSPEVKFVGGWKQFATENRLKKSDTLVFVLSVDARSEFQVCIFRGTGSSSSNSQSPARKRSNNSNKANISEEAEKGTNGGRRNLFSAGDENSRKTEVFFTETKKAVQKQKRAASETFEGSKCKGSVPKDEPAKSLPSFCRRLVAYNQKDAYGGMEVPASFVKTHGTPQQIRDDVKLQGILQESPVRIVTCYWIRHGDHTRLHFKGGWREFAKENGGQELQCTLNSDSFFVVRVV